MTRDDFIREWNVRFNQRGLTMLMLVPIEDEQISLIDIDKPDGARAIITFRVNRLMDAYLEGYLAGHLAGRSEKDALHLRH